jgi:hypothetical protein
MLILTKVCNRIIKHNIYREVYLFRLCAILLDTCNREAELRGDHDKCIQVNWKADWFYLF